MSEPLIYGIHAVNAVLDKSSSRISKIIINKDRNDKRIKTLRDKINAYDIALIEVTAPEMQKMYPDFVHQGVVAYVSKSITYSEKDIAKLLEKSANKALILILDGITDPHNLGACLRAADAAGVTFVIIPKDKSAEVTPLVSKIASGAAEFVPLIKVTNLVRTIKQLKSLGVWVYGTHLEADKSLYDVDLT